jgi:hypothetical protein
MGVALGALPSNFTFPLMVTVPVVLLAVLGRLSTPTPRPLEMQMITVKPITRMRFFVFIPPYLLIQAQMILILLVK